MLLKSCQIKLNIQQSKLRYGVCMIFLKKEHFSLALWISSLILISNCIGYATRPGVNSWYSLLARSPLTPPNYIFPVVWTLLYTAIGICGFALWHAKPFPNLQYIKMLYIGQLLLNWSWTPLFFTYHLISLALLVLFCMDFLVIGILYASHQTLQNVFFLMLPYLMWLLFATYLNFYIWLYN